MIFFFTNNHNGKELALVLRLKEINRFKIKAKYCRAQKETQTILLQVAVVTSGQSSLSLILALVSVWVGAQVKRQITSLLLTFAYMD